jgi:dTDP-4-dehydrorhamnose reductase
MKVLIIGKEGQLGSALVKLSGKETFALFESTGYNELDITSEESIRTVLNEKKPDFVINCTAYTAVVNAEFETDLAHQVNARGPQYLGRQTAAIGARVIHISTDYVFDGKSNTPLTPAMATSPLSVYGKTKLEGEQHLMEENPNSIIIRTSWLYSPYGQNFFLTMLGLGSKQEEVDVVYDQVGSPTYALDLAQAILQILNQANKNIRIFKPAVYHYSNEGVCSWFDFAHMIYSLAGIECRVNPIRTDVLKSIAPRPAYSVLDTTDIKKQFGISIPYWTKSLAECLKATKENSSK